MCMRTTRRLEITDSKENGTTFCCLEIVEPEYGGQWLLFGGHNFTEKMTGLEMDCFCIDLNVQGLLHFDRPIHAGQLPASLYPLPWI